MPRRKIFFDLDLNKTDMSTKFKAKDFEDLELHVTIKNNSEEKIKTRLV